MGEGTLLYPSQTHKSHTKAQCCAHSSLYIDIEIGATQKESGMLELADL